MSCSSVFVGSMVFHAIARSFPIRRIRNTLYICRYCTRTGSVVLGGTYYVQFQRNSKVGAGRTAPGFDGTLKSGFSAQHELWFCLPSHWMDAWQWSLPTTTLLGGAVGSSLTRMPPSHVREHYDSEQIDIPVQSRHFQALVQKIHKCCC